MISRNLRNGRQVTAPSRSKRPADMSLRSWLVALGLITFLLLGISQSAQASADRDLDCPITFGSPRLLGPPFPKSENWYGSEALAVMVPGEDAWRTTKPGARLAVRLFWWSAGFEPGMESNLKISVRNISGKATDAVVSVPTNAYAESLGGWTMLTGIDFPSAGCWEIRGEYRGQSLTFVVETIGHQR